MQTLLLVPDFVSAFPHQLLLEQGATESNEDFVCQLTKLVVAMLSGDYSKEDLPDYQRGIRPTVFRRVVGQGHPEFSTTRQQDVEVGGKYILNVFFLLLVLL